MVDSHKEGHWKKNDKIIRTIFQEPFNTVRRRKKSPSYEKSSMLFCDIQNEPSIIPGLKYINCSQLYLSIMDNNTGGLHCYYAGTMFYYSRTLEVVN